ncbi:xylulokinase [Enterocloster lavalensis]|uniref:xylulokinase n=1 Tax=Enterocloster lavalensis TaxID=460384 RepID=UPI002666A624|nr:xylulokinase [Enterocloster lavalensis]
MPQYLMGIDLGTSSVKVLLIDSSGIILGVRANSYEIQSRHPGWAEQDMDLLWEATASTIKELLTGTGIDPIQIKGIGLSGQMHGLVLLNRERQLIRPAIIWIDQRSASYLEAMSRSEIYRQFQEITLNTPGTGFYVSSLLWLKEQEPENYRKIWKALLPKDYIRYRLCGKIGTEETDASGTLIFDTSKRLWARDLAERVGIDSQIFPDCYTSCETAGTVTLQCARATGLAPGTPVMFGGGDQPMQAVGNGIISPGTVCANIGTGSQLSCVVDRPLFDKAYRTNTFCHVQGMWTIMGASLNGGIALNWLRDNFFQGNGYASLNRYIDDVPAGSDGLIFLPYLAGERSPHMDSKARAIFFGLTLRHNYKHFARAVMEGITFSLREAMEIFLELGISCEKVVASGGGAKSRSWLQIQADILGKEIYTSRCTQEACLGAAIIAGVGAGIYSSLKEACDQLVLFKDEIVYPQDKNCQVYEEQFRKYRQLYPCNRSLF